MLEQIYSYYTNTVNPGDIWKTKIFQSVFSKNNKKLKVGFCSVFPPFENGASAATYYTVKELAKHSEIELFLIPIKNKINKRLFSFFDLQIATLESSFLDVVIFFGLGDEYEKYSSKARCKKICWQTMHGTGTQTDHERFIFEQIKKADLILAFTKWNLGWYKKEVSHVAYLPHGVDTSLFAPDPKENHKNFTCLFVSRIHYYKGIMPFFDAIPLVLEKDPTIDFRFVSPIDKYSPYLKEIRERLSELEQKYPKNIHVNNLSWAPYDTLPQQYATADVLVFPSNNEGFGLPLIEAMSTQLPCIVLEKKPMSEIVSDGKTGFCLSAGKDVARYHDFAFPDPQQIAAKILFLKQHENKRKEMGFAGRKKVLEKYDIKNVTSKLISYCFSVCQRQMPLISERDFI